MQEYICITCGVQYESSATPPGTCVICDEDRQYVNPLGQSWTTIGQLSQRHKNVFELVAPEVYAIYSAPSFAIGQRAHLIISPSGNILWDCVSNIDESTVAIINALGGIRAIAISHPHFFSTMAQWSKAFGDVPVYVHQYDAKWVQRKFDAIHFWEEDEMPLWDKMKLIKCGGHFDGSCILFSAPASSVFVGDTIQVSPDLKTVSFMYSYPNLIPLPKRNILQIRDAISSIQYEKMYGAFGRYILSDAKACVEKSINRYLEIYE